MTMFLIIVAGVALTFCAWHVYDLLRCLRFIDHLQQQLIESNEHISQLENALLRPEEEE